MATSPSSPSIGDLTKELTAIAQSGSGKELQISSATHQKYLAVINEYRTALVAQLDNLATAAEYGSVGSLPSANDTKNNLIHASHVARDTITKYADYLDHYGQAITTVFNRFVVEDVS
jgi:hypothetical protein